MGRMGVVFAAFLFLALVNQNTGVVELPRGIARVSSEIKIPDGAHDLEIRGPNTILRLTDDFEGRAAISCKGCTNIKITGITIEGNRQKLAKQIRLRPYNKN